MEYTNEFYHSIFNKYYGYEYASDDSKLQEKAIRLRDDVIKRYKVKPKLWEVGTGKYGNTQIDPKDMDLDVIIQTDDDKMIECVYDKDEKFIRRKQ